MSLWRVLYRENVFSQVLSNIGIASLLWHLPSRYTVPAVVTMGLVGWNLLGSAVRFTYEDDGTYTGPALKGAAAFSPLAISFCVYQAPAPSFPILPFTPPCDSECKWGRVMRDVQSEGRLQPATATTLRRRPIAAAIWVAIALTCSGYLVRGLMDPSLVGDGWEERSLQMPLGGSVWAAMFASLSVAMLKFIGAELGPTGLWALPITSILVFCVQLWVESTNRLAFHSPTLQFSFGGLLVEELVLIVLQCYASCLNWSLLDHLDTLLVLDPSLPLVLPNHFPKHFAALSDMIQFPPQVDAHLLAIIANLVDKGQTHFAPRKYGIPLLLIYDFHSCVAQLVRGDGVNGDEEEVNDTRRRALAAVRLFLVQAYDEKTPVLERIFTVCTIPHATAADHAIFYAFAALIPRLVPIHPFLAMCDGLGVDVAFMPRSRSAVAVRITEPGFNIESHLPLKSREDLKHYATAIGGSIMSASVYLSWSVYVACPESPTRPVQALQWAEFMHGTQVNLERVPADTISRAHFIERARTLGAAALLAKIAGSAQSSARRHRFFLPLSSFRSTAELLSYLSGMRAPRHVILELLDQVDQEVAEVRASGFMDQPPHPVRRYRCAMVNWMARSSKKIRKEYS